MAIIENSCFFHFDSLSTGSNLDKRNWCLIKFDWHDLGVHLHPSKQPSICRWGGSSYFFFAIWLKFLPSFSFAINTSDGLVTYRYVFTYDVFTWERIMQWIIWIIARFNISPNLIFQFLTNVNYSFTSYSCRFDLDEIYRKILLTHNLYRQK